jgi:hypothetical protein
MTPNEWLGIGVAVSTLLGSLAIAVRFLVKHYLSELKPNGGSSLRDEQNRQGATIQRLEDRVDEIYRLLLNRAGKETK